eukprot:Gb_07109 [translate_table: standard]
MQVARPGIRVLLSRPWRPVWTCNNTNAPKYFKSTETMDSDDKNVHGRSLVRGLLGRREYTQLAYSPATYLDKKEVTDRVLEVLKCCPAVDPSKVGPSAHFEKDLRLDMLDTVEIMMAMEEEFALDIPNSEADKMTSSADIITYVVAHPQAK